MSKCDSTGPTVTKNHSYLVRCGPRGQSSLYDLFLTNLINEHLGSYITSTITMYCHATM